MRQLPASKRRRFRLGNRMYAELKVRMVWWRRRDKLIGGRFRGSYDGGTTIAIPFDGSGSTMSRSVWIMAYSG